MLCASLIVMIFIKEERKPPSQKKERQRTEWRSYGFTSVFYVTMGILLLCAGFVYSNRTLEAQRQSNIA